MQLSAFIVDVAPWIGSFTTRWRISGMGEATRVRLAGIELFVV